MQKQREQHQADFAMVYEDSLRFVAYASGALVLEALLKDTVTFRDKLQMVAAGTVGALVYHFCIKRSMSRVAIAALHPNERTQIRGQGNW